MTDITELARERLKEKFDGWFEREYKHLESSKYTDAVPHIKYGFWMAYQAGGAELVEAVEKAQGMETYWKTQCRGITDHCEELQARIAELESNTVKPPVHPTVASEKLDDETLQELIEFRRTTFEYHSKEGNKVQTIIHGVTLAALRELQERRKADSEPVAWTDEQELRDVDRGGCGYLFTVNPVTPHADERRIILLYRHAQPVPVVSADLLHTAASAIEDLLEHTDPNTSYYSGVWADVPGKLRAAMLQAGTLTNEGTKQAGNSPVIPCAEQRIADAVELLKQAAPAMLADNGGPNGPLVGRLKSPAIPDGYVMVPKEPTQAMCAAFNDSDYGRKSLRERYVAMLAAAAHDTPALNSVQSVATVPGKWVPVSERMPEDRTQVILWDAEIGEVTSGHYSHKTHTFYHCGDAIQNEITHWMPLPAAPQEVKGES